MTKELTLSSGAKASIKKGKGRDFLNALRKTQNANEIIFALIAEVTQINGKPIVMEDLYEMDLTDVLQLQMEIAGNFQSPQLNISSISAKPQGGGSGN